jgi:hypothetical protein
VLCYLGPDLKKLYDPEDNHNDEHRARSANYLLFHTVP